MKLMEFLTPNTITIGFKSKEKWGAIEELLNILVAAKKIDEKDRSKSLEALFVRERTKSTGMEHGVALPHASVDCIDEIIGSLAIVPEGIDFDCADKMPAHLVILLLIPRHRFQKHISTLAGIARLMNNGEFRKSLLSATTPQEAMDRIVEMETQESTTSRGE